MEKAKRSTPGFKLQGTRGQGQKEDQGGVSTKGAGFRLHKGEGTR